MQDPNRRQVYAWLPIAPLPQPGLRRDNWISTIIDPGNRMPLSPAICTQLYACEPADNLSPPSFISQKEEQIIPSELPGLPTG